LDAGGLVVWDQTSGAVHLIELAFRQAAQSTAASDPSDALPLDDRVRALRNFVTDNRIVQVPMQASKRHLILELLAQEFEPGRKYSEKMVNLRLGTWHPDTAMWRRYLVDAGFLDRDNGLYWRSGGHVPLDS
jgi:hypothetical protein